MPRKPARTQTPEPLPPKKGGFFYFTGLKAKQVAREGFSGEIKLCLNLNEVLKNNLYRSNLIDD